MFYHEVCEWEGDDDVGMYEYELGSQQTNKIQSVGVSDTCASYEGNEVDWQNKRSRLSSDGCGHAIV